MDRKREKTNRVGRAPTSWPFDLPVDMSRSCKNSIPAERPFGHPVHAREFWSDRSVQRARARCAPPVSAIQASACRDRTHATHATREAALRNSRSNSARVEPSRPRFFALDSSTDRFFGRVYRKGGLRIAAARTAEKSPAGARAQARAALSVTKAVRHWPQSFRHAICAAETNRRKRRARSKRVAAPRVLRPPGCGAKFPESGGFQPHVRRHPHSDSAGILTHS